MARVIAGRWVELSALALVGSWGSNANRRGLGTHISDLLDLFGVVAPASFGAGLLSLAEASILRLADGNASVDLELLELLA